MKGCSQEDISNCSLLERFSSLTLVAIIITIVLLTFLCCVCIKIEDMKLRSYLRKLAKQKGIKLDLDKLDAKPTQRGYPNTHLNENCTIMIPDVAIVL